MCGIFGQIAPWRAPSDCAESLRHRGPDDGGVHSLDVPGTGLFVSLAQRRLSIIDLSAAGRQPMSNEDGTVWITFNGEIYNFQELRRELIDAGHRFTSRTDTEVLVHGFEEWGEDLFPRLRGMFALGIWDVKTRRLTLARDHMGKKPIFYFFSPSRFYFASEIKALLATGDISLEPDATAIHDYLTYLYFPYPKTAYRSIWKLPPASVLHIDVLRDGTLSSQENRFWDAATAAHRSPPANLKSAIEEARALVEDVVKVRLMSDVPLGVFLSGGLDSGSIAAAAAKHHENGPLKTFSVGFGSQSAFDESGEASAVAQRLGTEHHTITADPECAKHIATVVRAFDEPFGNPTAILEYVLTKYVRKHVTVALSGDGGDEVFGGYVRYAGAALANRYRRLPKTLTRGVIAPLAARLSEDTAGHHGRRRLREFATSAWKPAPEMYLDWVGYFSDAEKTSLYTPEFAVEAGGANSGAFLMDLFARGGSIDALNRFAYVDLNSFLTGNCLEYADRMSMANSLEVRCPFTDHRLVEFGLRLPFDWKYRSGTTKYILREAMRGILPDAVLCKKKMGFNPPMPRWLSDELRPMIEQLLSDESVERRGFFRAAAVRTLLEEHFTARRDNALKIWALLVLELWCRMYVDRSSREIADMPNVVEHAEILA
jgi:asparagine synthase (glutamine-hydrolysing)